MGRASPHGRRRGGGVRGPQNKPPRPAHATTSSGDLKSQCSQHRSELYQRQPDEGGGIGIVDRLAQGDPKPLAFESACTIERGFAGDISLNGGPVEATKSNAGRSEER